MLYFAFLALGVAFALPVAVTCAALAQGKIGAAAMDGIARQPEAAGRIQTAMIIGLALIESLVIYVLVTFFLLQGRLPAVNDVLGAMRTSQAAVTTTAQNPPSH